MRTSLQDLPAPAKGENMLPPHITIPQPVGPAISIITLDVTTVSKMLGVNFSPAENSATHVEHMVQKGLEWADCLHTTPVSRNNAWLSFYLQLYPCISWGLVTTYMQPKKLDVQVQCVHAKALPILGVNRNIKKEWRTLPEQYQGIGMPNILLAALAEKLSFLVGNCGFHGQAHGDSLAMAYDNFLMEVGLYGSPLKWSYKEYDHLATYATWFQNLWQLEDVFKVNISVCDEDMVGGIQEHDRSLILELSWLGYKGKELAALNVVCLLYVSNISKCDRIMLNKFVILDMAETSIHYNFPCENPTHSDFCLWKDAIARLCSGSMNLPYTLGKFLHHPHLPCP